MLARLPPTARALLLSPWPVHLALSLALLVWHEPWRDEAHPWVIVRDAPQWWAMLDSEGSPGLWYLLLAPLAKLGAPFEAARLLHLALSSAAVALFVLRAPFSRVETWLFSLGYFVVYEYGAIARSYVLTMLLLFALAALHARRHAAPLAYAGALVLLANANGHGMLLAFVIGGAWGIEWLWRHAQARVLPRPVPTAAVVLPALAVLGAWAQMLPAPDVAAWRTDVAEELTRWHQTVAALGVVHAFAPLGSFGDWVWGTTSLELAVGWDALLPVGWAMLAAASLLLARRPRVLAVWLAGAALLLATYALKPVVSAQMRHHGLLFVFFVYCLWLARVEPRPARAPWLDRGARYTRPLAAMVVLALLAGQAAATVPAVMTDARESFSGGQGAGRYLREHDLTAPDVFVGIYPAFIAAAVLAHTPEKAQAHLLQLDRPGSYVRWTQEEVDTLHAGVGLDELIARAERAAAAAGQERIVLVTSFDAQHPRLHRLAAFGSLTPGDAANVWELLPAPSS